ncbi:hypothetical protein ANHYDRO_00948, partial [Anaerococcus hydrogenalis DSM 7454]
KNYSKKIKGQYKIISADPFAYQAKIIKFLLFRFSKVKDGDSKNLLDSK